MQSFPACASGFLASVNFGLGQLTKLVLVAVIVLLRKLNDFDVVGHHSLGVEGVLALFIKAKGCRVVWIPDQFLHLNVVAPHYEIEPYFLTLPPHPSLVLKSLFGDLGQYETVPLFLVPLFLFDMQSDKSANLSRLSQLLFLLENTGLLMTPLFSFLSR